jgi:3-dehydroquinate synthase
MSSVRSAAQRADNGRPAETAAHVHLQEFTVSFQYPVCFTTDTLDPANPTLADAISRLEPSRRHRIFVVLDEGVVTAWPGIDDVIARYVEAYDDVLTLAAPPEIVTGGEAAKNDPAVTQRLRARLHELRIDRHSFMVVIGGGALQDAAGYAAATAHRGVRIVRLPTTVLSQGDGGVGVKNGVNAFGTKNFIGTFAPPFAVVNDVRFIESLPRRAQIAGMAEAVKVALIRDPPFFAWLVDNASALAALDRSTLAEMIRRSAQVHLRHIATSGDPFEHGSARPLDFGHWAAHKLESLSDYGLSHGEAVGIGILLDARYSVEVGKMGEACLEEIFALLRRLGLPTWDEAVSLRKADGSLRLLDGLAEFREHLGGELTITLLEGIGRGVDTNWIEMARMERAIAWLRERGAAR